MNQNELHRKLIAAARAAVPGDRVPYAFEKRIMARLAALPRPDDLLLWDQALWRGAASCVALLAIIGACSFLLTGDTATGAAGGNGEEELSQAFENTLLASVDQSANTFEEVQ
jgi:hypothetical protein